MGTILWITFVPSSLSSLKVDFSAGVLHFFVSKPLAGKIKQITSQAKAVMFITSFFHSKTEFKAKSVRRSAHVVINALGKIK